MVATSHSLPPSRSRHPARPPATNCERRRPFRHADSFSNFRHACPAHPSIVPPSIHSTPSLHAQSKIKFSAMPPGDRMTVLSNWTFFRFIVTRYPCRTDEGRSDPACMNSLSLSTPLRVAIYVSCLSAVSASLTRLCSVDDKEHFYRCSRSTTRKKDGRREGGQNERQDGRDRQTSKDLSPRCLNSFSLFFVSVSLEHGTE